MAPIAPNQKPLEYRFDQASFGRHQTFHLRYSWLTKGFQALSDDPGVFDSDDSTVTLGVGKNMVAAIQYWLQATRVITRTPDGLRPTALGEAVFGEDGLDPYLEDEATLWLIHWLLATNGAQATVWRWFFNHFHQAEFSLREADNALTRFVQDKLGNKTPPKTAANDLRILLRMYEPSAVGPRVPLEDALDSPLSLLGLVRPLSDPHRHRSAAEDRDDLPDGVFGYAVAELFAQIALPTLPINELMYGRPGFPALGAVFRLTENALLTKLERIIRRLPGRFALHEQAGVHQIFSMCDAIEPMDFLRFHYRMGQPADPR
ncbi:DUF4007 family protein [uncultured Thiodictyon sp.]|uniref:DUF4007 family protein n=1 Tax=uncultured Thiodictyon sp. TaxID=1846217 RepID=UPI0025FF4E03|nr:DUF4007 family protein [uncultured Thiodictyon sp.]